MERHFGFTKNPMMHGSVGRPKFSSMNRRENREIQMKPFQKISISVFLMFQLAAFTACKTHPHKHKVAELLDDKVTAERVELALRQNGADEFNHVKVSTSEGVVTLTGFVSNSDAQRRAGKIAVAVHRGQKVNNLVEVAGKASPVSSSLTDGP
jgi:hypothetical protein